MNCYNSDKYLREAIDSVYAQTFQNWEIIFWDNASSDKSPKIAQSYDEKIKYFRSEQTTLLGEARDLAARQAEGKYLAFLDCDDLWMKDKLEKQVQIFKGGNQNLALVYGRAKIIYGENETTDFFPKKNQNLHEGDIFNYLCKGNFIPCVSAMVDKNKFYESGGFPKGIKHSPDYVVFLNIAKKYDVRSMKDIHCKYRIHEGNMTNLHQVTGAKEALAAVTSFLPDKSAESGLKYQNLNLAIAYLKNNDYFQALNLLFKFNLWGLFYDRLIQKINHILKG